MCPKEEESPINQLSCPPEIFSEKGFFFLLRIIPA